jgi:hypothetical protein
MGKGKACVQVLSAGMHSRVEAIIMRFVERIRAW